jgi:hypothetical protein
VIIDTREYEKRIEVADMITTGVLVAYPILVFPLLASGAPIAIREALAERASALPAFSVLTTPPMVIFAEDEKEWVTIKRASLAGLAFMSSRARQRSRVLYPSKETMKHC